MKEKIEISFCRQKMQGKIENSVRKILDSYHLTIHDVILKSIGNEIMNTLIKESKK